MKNGTSSQESVQTQSARTVQTPPSRDEIAKWAKQDLQAAHYFLGLLLRYPEAIEAATDELHKHVMLKENGAAIDKLKAN